MEDLISEYGFTIIILILGGCIIGGLASLLASIWNGGMFV